jgi:hypothetical protein
MGEMDGLEKSGSQLETLRWQFKLTWRLASEYTLPGLTDDACLWEPTAGSWNVRQTGQGRWRPDWIVPEPDPAPATTTGWLTWHLGWWWSDLLAAVRGETPAGMEEVDWPGSALAAVEGIERLAGEWTVFLDSLSEDDLERPLAHPWSEARPLRIALAWANVELMKNTAEIGMMRRLYEASRRI